MAAMLLLLGQQILLLFALALAALGAGAVVRRVLRIDSNTAMTIALGLAAGALLLYALGLAGQLNRLAVVLAALPCWAAAIPEFTLARRRCLQQHATIAALLAAATLLLLTITVYPPLGFDETLYHLPTTKAFAAAGSLPFVPYLRAPVFPHADEVLRVPLFLFGREAGAHVLSVLATWVAAAALWNAVRDAEGKTASWLSVAMFISAPLVVNLAVTSYVEALLTAFVASAWYAIERWRRDQAAGWLVAAALLAGSSASVKYLGILWVGMAAMAVFTFASSGHRMRSLALFCAVAAAVAVPWYARIVWFTGNPVFPFLPGLFGHTVWDPYGLTIPAPLPQHFLDALRLPWDGLFVRTRVGQQPPFSPALVAAIPLVLWSATKGTRTRAMLLIVACWMLLWTWLPRDSRYLVAALPFASAAAGCAVASVLRDRLAQRYIVMVGVLIALPGPLYAGYRLFTYGLPPTTPQAEARWLSKRVTAYPAIDFMNQQATDDSVAYVCGAEQLTSYFRGRMIGDYTGPARYDLFITARDGRDLATRFQAHRVERILVMKNHCVMPAIEDSTYFTKVFEDEVSSVYQRVGPSAVQTNH